MRLCRLSSHSKFEVKLHIVWVLKYWTRILSGPVVVGACELLRQIAMENNLQIISGAVAPDHVGSTTKERGSGNPHATVCGNRR
jgi:putative transposase